ncbi:hypothetical protein K3495_g6164 [Podosphaera aphanis]|nr:hypothetical protein K3495_g6164 [Podosphaera aphanis]
MELPPSNPKITIPPHLLQESENWRPPPSLGTASPDVMMVDALPTHLCPPTPNDAIGTERPQSSFAKSMSDRIDAEVEKFKKLVAQAKLVLSRFFNLLDGIDDEEIRRSTEIAAAGLRDQLTNTQTVASRLPTPERPKQTKAQNATPAVPQVSGADALRKSSSTQSSTHPLAGKQANTPARFSTAQKIAPPSTAKPPQIEGP